MSKYYAESNKESTIELFEKRTIYNETLSEAAETYKNLVDFNLGEKLLYGRVNRVFTPITLNKSFLPLKGFQKSTPPESNLSAVNFVVDAFNAMALQFKKCAINNQIARDDPFLSNLVVYKAFEDPEKLYSDYLTIVFKAVVGEFRRRNVRVRNFDEFLKEFELIMEKSAHEYPFTKSGYIKSSLCPAACSGLVVEIADLNYANDDEKITQFIESKNWHFYLNTCREYGFMVDRLVPWRLVADIGIHPTKSTMFFFAEPYGFENTDQILDTGYGYAHVSFYNKFKYFLLVLYNQVKLNSFLETKVCGGSPVNVQVIPQTYTPSQLSEKYSDVYFLKLYFRIRFLEEESQFTESEKEMIVDDSVEIFYSNGTYTCLEAFERILNKTFDYQGSVGYIRDHLSAVEGETVAPPQDPSEAKIVLVR
tara:strand:- start:2070 stop:3335 length:1266 start_codon:yes stop_codon:yes gene_type:complete